VALLAACLLPVFACGGSKKPAESAASGESAEESKPAGDTAPLGSASSSTPDTAGSAASDANAPPPLSTVLTTDAGAVQKMFDAVNTAPSATLKANGVAGKDALAKGVRDVAKRLTGGMQPDGPLAMGSIKEKQHLQTDVTLKPGKCYAIVGFSKKIKDLDLHLLLPPGILSGEDTTDDNRPIIGAPPQPMCPASATTITYKLDIYSDQGSGDVAVQLYSKDQ
jgi:hypothetical protein